MALGITGPIGDLQAYAMVATFTIGTAHNLARANCKGCNTTLEKTEGREVQVDGINKSRNRMSYYYFCATCIAQVVAATARLSLQGHSIDD